MPEQRLALDSLDFSDLEVCQYRNLLDLAQLSVGQPTPDSVFPVLALHLRPSLNFEFITLGLYDTGTESILLDTWKAGLAQKSRESVAVDNCANGWAWKNQRSVLIQDLDAETNLPVSLESLRLLGVHTYYVLPLTTSRHQLGAIGFGSLHVIQKTNRTLELLRRTAAMMAQFLDATLPPDAPAEQVESVAASSVVESRPKQAFQDFDPGEETDRDKAFREIIGNSAALQELLERVKTVAATGATVLLQGETGTGKELVARAIHQLSPRADRKFVTVNCTAIPTELLESELFGHEKGSFTGAINKRIGRLELADRGTLLLDEVGDLPGIIQPKLLRVLQEQEFERLGSNRTVKVDVRLIAATNQDLRRSIAEGRFREDLFYRLNVFPILIPPLRERKSDIRTLISFFVFRYAAEANKSIETIPAEAMEALENWSWPGNIRELQNLIQRCVILTNSPVLKVPLNELRRDANPSSGKMSKEVERELILQTLKETGGVIAGTSGAAHRLGMKRTTLYSKMKKLNISPVDFQN
jgi:formate hydrogenlyase transcriptional activator